MKRLASCFLRSVIWWSNFFKSFLKLSRYVRRGFSTSHCSWNEYFKKQTKDNSYFTAIRYCAILLVYRFSVFIWHFYRIHTSLVNALSQSGSEGWDWLQFGKEWAKNILLEEDGMTQNFCRSGWDRWDSVDLGSQLMNTHTPHNVH